MDNSPIGIFDSGLGGLSIWRCLKKALPNESIVYLGDGKRCPYGERSQAEIVEFSCQIVDRLLARGAKLIVVACNTATAMAIDTLRRNYAAIPIVGLEPAVKPAAESTRSGVVAVLATHRSFEGRLYLATSSRCRERARIIEAVGEGWVEIVEHDQEQSDGALETVRRVVEPLIEQGADRLVLGCTHYPFLRDRIKEVIGGRDVEIVDSCDAVERRVESLLNEYGLNAVEGHRPEYEFLSYADDSYVEHLRRKAYGKQEEK